MRYGLFQEQAKIAKLGLEMKLITSEMDAETEKWEEPDNDIVKRAKNMSSMAFAEEGKKLYKTVREFAEKVRPEILVIVLAAL